MATVLAFDREMAAEHGINAALLYQELKRKQRYWRSQGKLEDGFFYCDQGEIAEWVLVHPNTIGKAAKVLEEANLIEKKVSYRPGTLTPTTWWKVVDDSESTPEVISSNHSESDYHIKSNTLSTTEGGGGSIIDKDLMKSIIQKFIRDHQSQSNPIAFSPSRFKEYYPALKEWAIDNGIKLDRQKVLTVLENALDEMQNDGWLAGKDMAIAFKDTCIGSRINKQQKKGGLNDNEWV
jgi:hypothetical protein